MRSSPRENETMKVRPDTRTASVGQGVYILEQSPDSERRRVNGDEK